MVTTPLVKCKPLSDYMGSGDQMTNRNFYHTDDYGRLSLKGIFVDENADGTIHSLSVGEPLM
jgi:hypothetical protein